MITSLPSSKILVRIKSRLLTIVGERSGGGGGARVPVDKSNIV